MIYLDNAATSYPKPRGVVESVKNSFMLYGANPGRSGYDFSVRTAEEVYKCRQELNDFFNGYGAENISFTKNCTEALNIVIKGLASKGDHIIISSLEHNSVARPVEKLKNDGLISYSIFNVSENKTETIKNFKAAFKSNTRLCVVTAVSNVFGNILSLRELGQIAKSRGALFVVDGAQGAGVIKINLKEMGIDCLCVPGHKGLMGPMGTGAVIHNNLSFDSIIEGGTGTASFSLEQPIEYPERLESGTINVPGICGLLEGIRFVRRIGVDKIFDTESLLCETAFKGLQGIKNVKLYRKTYDKTNFAPVLSFNIENLHSEQVASLLNKGGIAVRGGYHCSALAHNFMGTRDCGCVRISPSISNTKKDINNLLNLVEKIAITNMI